ncbi:UDP-glycosyltransferase UGT4-like [Convolutriloba macropyga]|uniref:UDP-glycosyltransferase UGT4-like n=1 Tax=Convolutriloba macropyga TaxID=536237 RepID=UPI003F523626
MSKVLFVVFAVLVPLKQSHSLNILFSVPCWGGHFGTMSPLFSPICQKHNCTLVEWAKLCERKMKPFYEKVNFEVIKRHGLHDEYSFDGAWHFLVNFCPHLIETHTYMHTELSTIFEANRGKYDLVITDHFLAGSVIAAEKFDIPVVLQTPGTMAGVENVQDKFPQQMTDIFVLKLFFSDCWAWKYNRRALDNLPDFVDFQGNFFLTEFSDRYPSLIPGSLPLHAEPHSSQNGEYLFIGGIRNESHFDKLDESMETWIDKDQTDIIYISLGTLAVLDPESVKNFYENVRNQNNYRVIWSLGLGLERTAKEAGIYSEKSDRILLSDYLPQYTLLGHPKVKVFVSHVGLGSMIDFIKRKVPVVAIPQFADQFANAILLENLNLAIQLKVFKFEDVDKAIAQVFQNYDFYVQNLQKLSDEFEKHEDPELIDAFITKIAARKKTTVKYELEYEVNCPRFHVVWKLLTFGFYAFVIALFLAVLLAVRRFCIRGFAPKSKTS